MQLFIKLNQTFVVDLDDNATIDNLHEKIYDKTMIPKDYYYLSKGGKPINIGKLIEQNIVNQTTLNMSIRIGGRRENQSFQVFFKFEKTRILEINKNYTVEELRNKIAEKMNYHPNSFSMTANGKMLINGLVGKYGIVKDITIHCSNRPQFYVYHNTLEDNQLIHSNLSQIV